jgi:ELWxxDGT repeat protein
VSGSGRAFIPDTLGPLVVLGSALYFTAGDLTSGEELWRTDGWTVERVSDLNPGPASGSPQWLTPFGGTLYFSATNGQTGQEVWRLTP